MIFCQNCTHNNPYDRETCIKCGMRLMIITESRSSVAFGGAEIMTKPTIEEHLLERISALETALLKMQDRVAHGRARSRALVERRRPDLDTADADLARRPGDLPDLAVGRPPRRRPAAARGRADRRRPPERGRRPDLRSGLGDRPPRPRGDLGRRRRRHPERLRLPDVDEPLHVRPPVWCRDRSRHRACRLVRRRPDPDRHPRRPSSDPVRLP